MLDEVSMVEPCFLDFLDQRVRQVRGSQSVFGGIQATHVCLASPSAPCIPHATHQLTPGRLVDQLIFCGDFCQLPGITKGLALGQVARIPQVFSD